MPKAPSVRKRAIYWSRVSLAACVLLAFVYAYIAGAESNRLLAVLAYTQFSAALADHSVVSIVVLAVALSSLLFGRVFCSVLCPLGIAQEFSGIIGRFFGVKSKGYSAVKKRVYVVPMLAGIGAVLGISALVILFDPFSNFGSGMIFFRAIKYGGTPVIAISLLFFAILAASFFFGRIFCEICPVGLTLGLFSSVAPYGISLPEKCVSCGSCEKKCPARCINSKEKRVETNRCVLCMSCVSTCPGCFVSYGRRDDLASREKGVSRRFFLKNTMSKAAWACGAIYLFGRDMGAGLARVPWKSMIKGNSGGDENYLNGKEHGMDYVIMPPGAGSAGKFSRKCVACQSCAAVCPVNVIKPNLAAHPTLVYSNDFCQFNCTECSDICPAGALDHLSADEKRRTRVGVSSLDFGKCVVKTKDESCGACAEVCPTRAVRMVPYQESGTSGLTRPEFDEEYCIGCGACLVACPAAPKAFKLRGVEVQTLTPGIRPSDDEGYPVLPPAGDFPF